MSEQEFKGNEPAQEIEAPESDDHPDTEQVTDDEVWESVKNQSVEAPEED